MTIFFHEIRRARLPFFIWTASIGFLLAVCILIYPEMSGNMDSYSAMFSSMGPLTEAFGMDRLGFGTMTGFYAIECGSVLCLGGAFFAAMTASNIISREEKEHTAEYLLTHPVSRTKVLSGKLAAVVFQITLMNAILFALSTGLIYFIGEEIPFREIGLLHLAYFIMQIEIAGICFMISAFITGGSIGAGLGITVMLYFMNLIANTAESVSFMNRITPFGYCNGADILENMSLDKSLIAVGAAVTLMAVLISYIRYLSKDIK